MSAFDVFSQFYWDEEYSPLLRDTLNAFITLLLAYTRKRVENQGKTIPYSAFRSHAFRAMRQ